MRAGLLRRLDHLRRSSGVGAEPGDVLGDGAVEQLHPLRQVADMLPQDDRVVLLQRRAAQPDHPARRPPDAGDGSAPASICRTPTAPITPSAWPGRTSPLISRSDACCWPGGTTVSWCITRCAFGRGRAVRGASTGTSPSSSGSARQPRQAALHHLPLRDQHVDRRQRPAQAGSTRRSSPRRGLAADHQQRRQPQHRRLQEHPEGPRMSR